MLEQILQAQETVKAMRRAYNAGNATYDDMKDAAIALLELRQHAERIKFGKPRTRITSLAIAAILR
jgi:outer membrane protein TolC